MARVVIPGFRKIEVSGGGEGGTTNYNDLTNKPSINNVPLVGNLRTVDLKLTDATLTEEGVPAEAKTVGTKLEEHSTSLTALSEKLGNHTVKSDVPENAVFTDTVYDDSAIKEQFTKAIDDIEIGGRNLLVGTKDFNITNAKEVFGHSYILTDKYNGFSVRYYNLAWNFYRPTISLKAGTYTFSTYAKGTEGNNLIMTINNKVKTYNLTSDWERYILVFDVEEDKDVTLYIEANRDVDLYQCGWKLEIGNKATDWAPAIEDTEAEIQAVDNKLTTNLLKPTLGTTTQNGVTCTNNGDGTYTFNGTATAKTTFIVQIIGNIVEKYANKDLWLVGCPKNGSMNTYRQHFWCEGQEMMFDTGSGTKFRIENTAKNANIAIIIEADVTVDNEVFKPMITTNLNATYDDFVPYTGDTGKLNSDVSSLLKRIETLESLVNKTDTVTTE